MVNEQRSRHEARLHPPAHDVQRVRDRLRDEAGDGAEAQHELDRQPRRGGAVGHHGVLPILLLQGLRGRDCSFSAHKLYHTS